MFKRGLWFCICVAMLITASGMTAFGGQAQWAVGDGNWNDPNNWYVYEGAAWLPGTPGANDDVYFWGRTSWTPTALDVNVYINSGVSAVGSTINSLGGGEGALTGTLYVNYGGSLTAMVGLIMGQLGDSGLILDGGTLEVSGYAYMYIGHDFNGTFIVRGGNVDCYTIYMPASSGSGYWLMDNGIVNCRNWVDIMTGQLNIRGGIIQVPGDQRALYSPFIANGSLVAFGGAADVNVAFDGTKTYITAAPRSTTPYIKTTPTAITVNSQGPTSQNYSIVLNTNPGANVTVTVAPYYDPNRVNLGAGIGVPITKTFTSANWNVPQTVTVTAVPTLSQATEDIVIRHTAVSTNASYNDIMAYADVKVHALGNVPSLTIVESGGNTTVSEAGMTDSFTVALSQNPGSTVTVKVDPNGNGLGNHLRLNGTAPNTPVTLTFTSANWNTPQTITVAAVDTLSTTNLTAIVNLTAAGGTYAGVNAAVNVKVLGDGCGAWGFSPMDFNHDCKVDFKDFATFAQAWLECTNPKIATCVNLLP